MAINLNDYQNSIREGSGVPKTPSTSPEKTVSSPTPTKTTTKTITKTPTLNLNEYQKTIQSAPPKPSPKPTTLDKINTFVASNPITRALIPVENPTIQAVSNAWVEGFSKNRTRTPEGYGGYVAKETVKEMGKSFTSMGKGVLDFFLNNVPKAIATTTKMGYEVLPFKEGKIPDKIRDTVVDTMTLWQQDIDSRQKKSIQQISDLAITDPRRIGYGVGNGVASIGLAVALGGITKSATVAGLGLGLIEGSDTYERSQEFMRAKKEEKQGAPLTAKQEYGIDLKAAGLSIINTVGIAALEKWGLTNLLSASGFGKKVVGEVVQEVSQTIFSNAVEKYGYNKTQQIMQDVGETILITTLTAGLSAKGLELLGVNEKVIGKDPEGQLISLGMSPVEAQNLINKTRIRVEEEAGKINREIKKTVSKQIDTEEKGATQEDGDVQITEENQDEISQAQAEYNITQETTEAPTGEDILNEIKDIIKKEEPTAQEESTDPVREALKTALESEGVDVEGALKQFDAEREAYIKKVVPEKEPVVVVEKEEKTPEVMVKEKKYKTEINTLKAFNNSKLVKTFNDIFVLGTFGKNSADRKIENQDRFPESELAKTIENITESYRASNDPKNYRIDNIAHIAVMPNGEKRVIYTRQNEQGKEEILNWHKVSNEKYIEDIKAFGAPEGTRTPNRLVRTEKPYPLGDKSNTSIIPKNTKNDNRTTGDNLKPETKEEVKKEEKKEQKKEEKPKIQQKIVEKEEKTPKKQVFTIEKVETLAQEKFGKPFQKLVKKEIEEISELTKKENGRQEFVEKPTDEFIKKVAPASYSTNNFNIKPELLWGGMDNKVFTDAFMLIHEPTVAIKLLEDAQKKTKQETRPKGDFLFPDWQQIMPPDSNNEITFEAFTFPQVNLRSNVLYGVAQNGETVAINAQYYTLIKKYFPNAQFFYTSENKPIIVKDGANRVGLLMPIMLDRGYEYEARKKDEPVKEKFSEPLETQEDVGEKIGGARKDLWGRSAEKYLTNPTDREIALMTVDQAIPKLDYKDLIEKGVLSPENAIQIAVLRGAVAVKPRRQSRLRAWIEGVQAVRLITQHLITYPDATEKMDQLFASHGNLKTTFFDPTAQLYTDLDYLNNDKLQKFTLQTSTGYTMDNGEKTDITLYDVFFGANRVFYGTSYEKVKDYVAKEIAPENNTKRTKTPAEKFFGVFKMRLDKRIVTGYKKGSNFIEFETFASLDDARATLKDPSKIEEYIRKVEEMVRFDEMTFRTEGESTKATSSSRGNKNISSEQFGETFGFRGVEFGNWVNQEERQERVNKAYDALSDLAHVLGIPPRAIGLNGELGFAFGSRGRKGALAHYEAAKVVINLTKEGGAGTIAHEWFHALDNYLSRKDGETLSFVSETKYSRDKVNEALIDLRSFLRRSGVLRRSAKADSRKAKKYFSEFREVFARAFEVFIKTELEKQGFSNNFLVNVGTIPQSETLKEVYPYAYGDEAEKISEKFKAIFDAIEVEDTDTKALYEKTSYTKDTIQKVINQRPAVFFIQDTGKKYKGLTVKAIETDALIGMDKEGYADLDQERVKFYEDKIDNKEELEPLMIDAFEGNLYTEDGKHRLQAYRNKNVDTVEVVDYAEYLKQYYSSKENEPIAISPMGDIVTIKNVVDTVSTNISKNEAEEILRRYFSESEVPVHFVDAIRTPDGFLAFGQYFKGMVSMINNPRYTTPHHEAIHAFLDLFTAPEYKRMYLSTVQNRSDWESIKKYYKDQGDDLTDDEIAEEYIATNFTDYVKGREKRPLFKRWFDTVIDFLKKIFDKGNVDNLYNDVMNRERTYIKPTLPPGTRFFEQDPNKKICKTCLERALQIQEEKGEAVVMGIQIPEASSKEEALDLALSFYESPLNKRMSKTQMGLNTHAWNVDEDGTIKDYTRSSEGTVAKAFTYVSEQEILEKMNKKPMFEVVEPKTAQEKIIDYVLSNEQIPQDKKDAVIRKALEYLGVKEDRINRTIATTPLERARDIQLPVKMAEGKQKESRLYQRLKEEYGGTDMLYYDQVRFNQQFADAENFVERYPEKAKDIMLGIDFPPPGLLGNHVSLIYADKLKNEGKKDIALSGLISTSLRSTRYGQEIGSLRGRIDINSPEETIKEVLRRKRAVATKYIYRTPEARMKTTIIYKTKEGKKEKTKEVVKERAKEVSKEVIRASQVKSFTDFIKKMEC